MQSIQQLFALTLLLLVWSCDTKKTKVEPEGYTQIVEEALSEENTYVDKIIFTELISFKTAISNKIERTIRSTFSSDLTRIEKIHEFILCDVPISLHGYNLLTYKSEELQRHPNKDLSENIYNNFLTKRAERGEFVNNVRKIYSEPFDPKLVKEFALFTINSIKEINTDNYIWTLSHKTNHVEDNYKGIYCKFTTYHTNPAYEEYDPNRKDYCMVSERFSDKVIDWIPLTDNMTVKGDEIEINVNKILVDELMINCAEQVVKLCDLAIELKLPVNKVYE